MNFDEITYKAMAMGGGLIKDEFTSAPAPRRQARPYRPKARLQRLEGPGQWRHAMIIDLVDAAEELELCRQDFEAARKSGNLGAHMLEVYRFKRTGMIFDEHLEVCRAIGKDV